MFFDCGLVARHTLTEDNGRLAFGAPTVLSERAVRKLGRSLAAHRKRGAASAEETPSLIQRTVLIESDDRIAWLHDAQVRRTWFKGHALNVPHPRLLFIWHARSLSVFAVKARTVSLDTPLYHAPYWNTGEEGAFCLGSAPLPGQLRPAAIPDAEAAFFDAQFTHRNGDHSVLAQGDDSTTGLFAFWRSLDGQRQFPRQQLVRAGLRLKEAL